MLQAQIAGYHEDGYPLIYLYACIAPDVSFNLYVKILYQYNSLKTYLSF